MKKVLTILFILCVTAIYAQKTYVVNGESLVLNKETEGPIYFLWNSTNGQFRYFIQTKNDDVIELTNTKDLNDSYKEEYKDVLYDITGNNPAKVKLTTYSIKDFIKRYNRTQNIGTPSSSTSSKRPLRDRPFDDRAVLDWRFGSAAGFTNHPFITNPEGAISMTFQTELEAFQENERPRHSLFMGFKFSPFTTIKENVEYMALQPSLGYRFRFVNLETINFHVGTRFAVFTYSEYRILSEASDEDILDTAATEEVIKRNRNFDFPFIFSFGTDIKVKKNGYITILFDSLFAIFAKQKNSKFPLDLSIGYKFNL